ncbi:hypothetical protein CCH79_00013886 [Gambusia affinis]|uniref:Uncharacterized protein n=1 Tax=Gambusia affinis TaxID=33528 RepID=A0A315VV15_GAMAF|nr:hypothetical protein CCH79_00013886 [Gambusia affinis]
MQPRCEQEESRHAEGEAASGRIHAFRYLSPSPLRLPETPRKARTPKIKPVWFGVCVCVYGREGGATFLTEAEEQLLPLLATSRRAEPKRVRGESHRSGLGVDVRQAALMGLLSAHLPDL